VSVIVKICELVPPLCHYAERVFEECYDDEEAANSWEVPVGYTLAMFLSRLSHTSGAYSRLDGVRDSVQHVLELARLRPQLVQRTRVVPAVIVAPRVAKRALVAQMVASCAAYLRHGWCM
jgi:hypothetical protein